MNIRLVREWMTSNPITISLQTTLPETYRLMRAHNIRRLPVMDKDKLVGIVTRGDIRETQPSSAKALSVYEVNYMLDNMTAKEFMTADPITVSPDTTIAEAARLMVVHKFGGLPVLEVDKLVGIITETDFCRLLMSQRENAA